MNLNCTWIQAWLGNHTVGLGLTKIRYVQNNEENKYATRRSDTSSIYYIVPVFHAIQDALPYMMHNLSYDNVNVLKPNRRNKFASTSAA